MQDGYRLAFDLVDHAPRFPPWLAIIILPVIGFILVVTPQSIVDKILPNGPKGGYGKIFAWMFFLFTTSIVGFSTYSYIETSNELRSAKDAGHVIITEGCLEAFHPMPEAGHEDERLRVNGREFAYSDFDQSSPAFNNTESHGGPIHADSKVKITSVGEQIVRLEVQDHACPPAPDFGENAKREEADLAKSAPSPA